MTIPETEPRAWWDEVQHLREPAEQRSAVARDESVTAGSVPAGARRTVQIRGQALPSVPARRLVEVERRRDGRGPVERMVARPDRIALWAVLFGLVLVVVAATSAHAATL